MKQIITFFLFVAALYGAVTFFEGDTSAVKNGFNSFVESNPLNTVAEYTPEWVKEYSDKYIKDTKGKIYTWQKHFENHPNLPNRKTITLTAQ